MQRLSGIYATELRFLAPLIRTTLRVPSSKQGHPYSCGQANTHDKKDLDALIRKNHWLYDRIDCKNAQIHRASNTNLDPYQK